MELEQLKKLEYIKRLSTKYLNILKPADGQFCNAEIRVLNYSELGCIITNMLKLCILALEQDNGKKSAIDVGLVLEQALHLFPSDEMELLDRINDLLVKKTNIGSN
ncbi:hypothetical protein [Flavobacterium sp. ACN6]|uniref:hypothetical protein n=1 Tax=Flavobacterium sp. ACN6 TaxID=1920426 RepID=UPI000BB378A3|nr:hypothetical protein [Flavobacterium sp. ACN6]PBJ11928.1 hypothetical protein BSF42_26610 [Flavobacterium sp. ACN6]